MRLLLDTNAMLWALGDLDQLSSEVRRQIADTSNDVFVSVVSPWEAAIKQAAKKLELKIDLEAELEASAIEILTVTVRHAMAAGALPPHHRDPFDRMIIAQAQLERLTIVTRDTRFKAYGVDVLGA